MTTPENITRLFDVMKDIDDFSLTPAFDSIAHVPDMPGDGVASPEWYRDTLKTLQEGAPVIRGMIQRLSKLMDVVDSLPHANAGGAL